MPHIEAALRLRIFLGADDKYKGRRPLYEEIVEQARSAFRPHFLA